MPKRSSSKLLPYEKARTTGRWAEIIFRALSARVANRWRFVSFRGPAQGESKGIVDVIAIRKDTSQPQLSSLKPGDLFEIVLVQMKGGSARQPSTKERCRLRLVAKRYHARDIVLFRWRKGVYSQFFTLGQDHEWKPTTGTAVFGDD